MVLFPFVLLNPFVHISERTINHERVHVKQALEMLVIPFYVWYLIELVVRAIQYRDWNKGYCNISFEREAYGNDLNLDYLTQRKWYAWIKYL